MKCTTAPLIASLSFVLLIVAGCGRSVESDDALSSPPVLNVWYVRPTVKEIADYAEFIGETEGTETVDVRARVSGFLNRIAFQDGVFVREGDLLFEIDSRLYTGEFERAEAALVQAEARLRRVTADLRRAQKLIKTSDISQEQYDLAAGAYAEAVAQVRVADAQRRTARLNADYCRVTAPMSGRASRTRVDAGNLVKADETILTNIVASDPIEVNLQVDERSWLHIRRAVQSGVIPPPRKKGLPIQVWLADEDSAWHEGAIDFFDNHLDPTTGTVRARGIVPNADRLFAAGMFVRVRVRIGPPHEVVVVSEKAVAVDGGERFVWVLTPDNHVARRKIETESLLGGNRVVRSGLSSADRVLVSGLQRLRPGMAVAAELDPNRS